MLGNADNRLHHNPVPPSSLSACSHVRLYQTHRLALTITNSQIVIM